MYRRAALRGTGCRHASLYTGVKSVSHVTVPEFKRDVGEFTVLQQMGTDGKPLPGIEMPFSWEDAIRMYECMVRSSVYDVALNEMQRQGRITFYCTNHGEEAASTASGAALELEDMVWPQYRELGMFLWRGLDAQHVVDCCMGNEGDDAKGRALPVHYMLPNANVQVVHAVLGTHIAQAPGAGYAYKLNGEKRCAVAYFGDGAASEGDALSALNYASVLKSQTIFICRNNGYSISTPVSDQYAGDGIAARGAAFDIPTIRIDGNDVFAVYNGVKAARKHCVENSEPVLVELMTYRVGDHTTSDNSSAYRTDVEVQGKCVDGKLPIDRFRLYLEGSGKWNAELEKELRGKAQKEIMAAMKSGEQKLRANPTEMFTDMYDKMPWHLQEQHDAMHEHIRNNRDRYNVSKYRGL
eukprot:TRINITY_DN6304_c0_g1_i2.p2 TRINITY_DN6304_c0_g1~~TRINITY_DN6304_c0_g1_i2.p2  ORF type:complete len:410 (+),score=133.35 TRINITY_DN6304_c0_g1_i2:1760-2989(+)